MYYVVKYTVYFLQQDISVSDELEIEHGLNFYDHDLKKELKVDNKQTAKKYVTSLYKENEDNVIIIPQSIWDSEEGLTDTELTINSVKIL